MAERILKRSNDSLKRLTFDIRTHIKSKEGKRYSIQKVNKIKQVWPHLSDKTDLRSKNVRKDKERQYVMIKRSTHQEAMTIINIYAPNIRALKYMKKTLTELKREMKARQ